MNHSLHPALTLTLGVSNLQCCSLLRPQQHFLPRPLISFHSSHYRVIADNKVVIPGCDHHCLIVQVRCGQMSRESTWSRGKSSACSGSESSFEVTTSSSPDLMVRSVPGEWPGPVSRRLLSWLTAGSDYQIQSIYPGSSTKPQSSSTTLPRQLHRSLGRPERIRKTLFSFLKFLFGQKIRDYNKMLV